MNKINKGKKANQGFNCCHCGRQVLSPSSIGTAHRNHCPFCLWSRHVDLKKSGDRKSICKGEMEPIGLTFKQEGFDKQGNPKQGEIMIIHYCKKCGKISINRIASDDNAQEILNILEKSKKIPERIISRMTKNRIKLLTDKDREEVFSQLFGKV